MLQAFPVVTAGMAVSATIYLLYLAYRVATAPVGAAGAGSGSGFTSTPLGGFLLGIANPKAYLAFMSLMASYSIVRANASADAAVKWLLCAIVTVAVDIAWLWLGAIVRRVDPRPATERALNVVMGATILVAAVPALI